MQNRNYGEGQRKKEERMGTDPVPKLIPSIGTPMLISLAGFLTALEEFVSTPKEAMFERQQKLLDLIWSYLEQHVTKEIFINMQDTGRLGTYQPLLLLTLPEGKTALECNRYTRSLERAIDIGTYTKEFQMPENLIFLNAYNLQGEEEAYLVAKAVAEYIEK